MTGLLTGLIIPPWFKWAAYAVGAVASASVGAYIDHKLMDGKVARAQAQTAAIQSEYASYKAQAAANALKTALDTLNERKRLEGVISDLEESVAKQKKVADTKSAQLTKVLHDAKPGDVRPLGPAALDYIDRLRGP